MMKNISLLIIVLGFLSGSAFAQTKCVGAESLNFRSSPAISSTNLISKLAKGTSVTIVSVSGDWAYVSYNDQKGYVYNSYLTNCYAAPNINSTESSTQDNNQYKPQVRVGAICNDGSRSYATGRGACSHHGGVDYWLYE